MLGWPGCASGGIFGGIFWTAKSGAFGPYSFECSKTFSVPAAQQFVIAGEQSCDLSPFPKPHPPTHGFGGLYRPPPPAPRS